MKTLSVRCGPGTGRTWPTSRTLEGDPIFVADGAAADPITIALQPNDWPHQHNPVWSFDDQWIYFVRGFMYGINETDEMDIWRIRSTGGKPERMTVTNTAITYLAPLDARTLLYIARSENREGPWLWSLDTVTRERRRVSSGLERYSSVAASRDGRGLWQRSITRPRSCGAFRLIVPRINAMSAATL